MKEKYQKAAEAISELMKSINSDLTDSEKEAPFFKEILKNEDKIIEFQIDMGECIELFNEGKVLEAEELFQKSDERNFKPLVEKLQKLISL